MKKRFISKKKTRFRLKFLGIVFLIVLSFAVSLSFFSSFFTQSNLPSILLKNSLSTDFSAVETDIFDFLLDYTIGEQEFEEDIYDGSTSPQEYTPDPAPEENQTEPLIYIYNSHQGEEYGGDVLSDYDVVPTVMMAAYRLREHLNNAYLPTMVETSSISEVLKSNGWNYNQSYKASRLLIESAQKTYPSIKYLIDLHRDALPYESSIVEHNGLTYAKILFVIGRDYEENLALAEKLSNLLNEKVPNLSKGIMRRTSSSGGPVFNQDLSPNALLIEVGGQYNKISEVNNSIGILAEVLKEVINE